MIFIISSPCEAAGQQLDVGDHELGFGAGDGRLEIFGQSAVAPEPSKGALHHPTFRFGHERSIALRSRNDFDCPPAKISERIE